MNDITEPAVGISDRPIRISRLEVRFEVPGIEFKRIYANGRMQARVWVMVEAVDEETGASVPLSYYPDLISTRLIQYHDGEPLKPGGYMGQPMPGWTASHEKNRYTQQMPGATYIPHASGGSTGAVLELWVSSSEVDNLQIAAEITVQGKVYKSNNTVNPDGSRINKSVVIVAERTPAYSLEHFTWVSHQIEGSFEGAMVFRYCLGLYLAGQQIKLLEWDTKQYEGSGKHPIKFCYTGLIMGASNSRSLTGVMASTWNNQVRIRGIELLVNPPVGELVAFRVWHPDYKYSEETVRLNDFLFTVLDEFGNVHNLALVIDIQSSRFVLRKG